MLGHHHLSLNKDELHELNLQTTYLASSLFHFSYLSYVVLKCLIFPCVVLYTYQLVNKTLLYRLIVSKLVSFNNEKLAIANHELTKSVVKTRSHTESEVMKMQKNTKQTSKRVASKASKVMRDGRYRKTAKSVAGSALAQTKKSGK